MFEQFSVVEGPRRCRRRSSDGRLRGWAHQCSKVREEAGAIGNIGKIEWIAHIRHRGRAVAGGLSDMKLTAFIARENESKGRIVHPSDDFQRFRIDLGRESHRPQFGAASLQRNQMSLEGTRQLLLQFGAATDSLERQCREPDKFRRFQGDETVFGESKYS